METIMVTGASRGIGLELARQALERGDRVIATTRRAAAELDALGAAHAGRLIQLRLDVGLIESIIDARAALDGVVDAIDILVNSAGAYSHQSEHWDPDATLFDTVTQEELIEVFRVNAAGPMLVTQHFLNLVRASRRGRIVNLTSLVGSVSSKTGGGDYAYAASKAALNIMTRALAAELAPEGIVALVITPGWVRTRMGGPTATLTPAESVRGLLDTIGRLTTRDAGQFLDYQGTPQPW
jgi:NAD(P)-dependent dehydrogenase (short-subunit alcohol dehydrogenase family)